MMITYKSLLILTNGNRIESSHFTGEDAAFDAYKSDIEANSVAAAFFYDMGGMVLHMQFDPSQEAANALLAELERTK